MVTLTDLRNFAKYHLIRRVHDHPAPEREMGVALLGYDTTAYGDELMRERAGFDVSTVAEVAYEGRQHPIFLVATNNPNARRTLLVLAGVHGNEQAGLLAIPRLLDTLEPSELEGVELRIVTPVNAVGAAEGSRYNANGFDINRDFSRFETPEASAVLRVFGERRPDMIVSLHEGPQDASFLFTNRYVSREVADGLLLGMGRAGVELATQDYFGRRLDPPGLAPMTQTFWALSMVWEKTLGMMATGMWADGMGIPEVTLESSWRCADSATRVDAHVALVRAALAELG